MSVFDALFINMTSYVIVIIYGRHISFYIYENFKCIVFGKLRRSKRKKWGRNIKSFWSDVVWLLQLQRFSDCVHARMGGRTCIYFTSTRYWRNRRTDAYILINLRQKWQHNEDIILVSLCQANVNVSSANARCTVVFGFICFRFELVRLRMPQWSAVEMWISFSVQLSSRPKLQDQVIFIWSWAIHIHILTQDVKCERQDEMKIVWSRSFARVLLRYANLSKLFFFTEITITRTTHFSAFSVSCWFIARTYGTTEFL